jgi:hypothetical protein
MDARAFNVDPVIEPTFVVHVNVSPVMELLFWSYPIAVKDCTALATTFVVFGETTMYVS